ncbi:Tnks [Symbiodinium necroappetens]|uniref:Poly [ADP-ribose] polymerase n=1 Tax=Symbiodinium necroappetens TaxID=1628268 RepID=A0A813B698_9DINO|nr:Tnks [Symbiodinium necroappetens]
MVGESLGSLALCLGSFAAGCCSANFFGKPCESKKRSGATSAARKGRVLRSNGNSPVRSNSFTTGTELTRSFSDKLVVNVRTAVSRILSNGLTIPHTPSVRSSMHLRKENWRGRIWSLRLGAGGSTSVEGTFNDDGVHWIVTIKERGPGVDVKAVLLTDDGSHELEHDCGQSFHGQTPFCEGSAVLQLHFRNRNASFSERNIEVKMFLFRAGARIGEHSFLKTAMLMWVSEVIHRTFQTKDVKLKADHLKVIEVERVMHSDLWDAYVQTRKEISMQLSRESAEHFPHASTSTETIVDQCIPMPLAKAANEHWLFHGTSPTNVMSIFEDGFEDHHRLEHGSAFGSGIYFTECSSKADMYASVAEHTDVHDHGGLCCMLLCRVTLGRSRTLSSEFHVDTARLNNEMKSGSFHSVLADRERLFASYREFVTPASQTYPEFLIWYERQQKSSFQQWKDQQWGGSLF